MWNLDLWLPFWLDGKTSFFADVMGGVVALLLIGGIGMQRRIRAKHAMFTEIVTLTTDWVWECDLHARYTFASERIRDVLGYAPEEVIGKTACDLAPPDQIPAVVRALKPLLDGPRAFSGFEVPGLHRDGTRVLLEVSGMPIVRADGKLAGYRGVVRDVTEREAHKHERQRLATAIAHAEDIVMIFDREGTIQYVNPAFEAVSGYTPQEAVGSTGKALLQCDAQPVEAIDQMWAHLQAGHTWTGHIINARRDGKPYHVDATISPIFDDNSAITGFVAVQRDVTEKLELLERLRKAVEMERFGNLVNAVAHEVRNPLNAIQAAAAALELDYGRDPDARELFHVVHSQVDRLAQLMRDLLAIGKPIDSMWLQPRRGSEIVQEALALWRGGHSELDTARVRVECDSRADVLADTVRMQQVIVNLLDNALQHGGDRADVVLSVDDIADGCRIRVRDSGRGIRPADVDRIFEPFFTTRPGGTGLGLALVKSIVERHGGSVSLYNNDPDRGCTFEIVLPVVPAKEQLHGSEVVDRGRRAGVLPVDVPLPDTERFLGAGCGHAGRGADQARF